MVITFIIASETHQLGNLFSNDKYVIKDETAALPITKRYIDNFPKVLILQPLQRVPAAHEDVALQVHPEGEYHIYYDR